jgi:hypothetical protein
MPVKEVAVELGWGPAKVSGTWAPDQTERDAAWELYVELVTRIAVVPLAPGEGILREALTSLYQLFGQTREILRKYGPGIGRPAEAGHLRFGYLAVWMLNAALRPFLASWHPRLTHYENGRPPATSIVDWETAWSESARLRQELGDLQQLLLRYAHTLAEVCDAPGLIQAADEVLASRRT